MKRSPLTFCLVLALLVSGNAWCAPASSSPSGAAALAGRLYRTFAWESLSPADATTSKLLGAGLADQPLAELEKYFDASLASAIAADADCVKRHQGEVCNLDFDILFASQDPGASDIAISEGGNGKVQVTFTYPSDGQTVHVNYLVVRTPAGPRITDIVYPDMKNASLRSLLRNKI